MPETQLLAAAQVWPEVHGKYHEASKEARLTNQNAKLAEEELEKLRLAQSQASDATSRQAQVHTHVFGSVCYLWLFKVELCMYMCRARRKFFMLLSHSCFCVVVEMLCAVK